MYVLFVRNQQILEWLEKENMVYQVPNGANDDWYWMYSTIYKGRKKPALVVSSYIHTYIHYLLSSTHTITYIYIYML